MFIAINSSSKFDHMCSSRPIIKLVYVSTNNFIGDIYHLKLFRNHSGNRYLKLSRNIGGIDDIFK